MSICNLHTKFELSSFTRYKDMIGAPKIKNGSSDSDHANLGVSLSFKR